jgi:DNA-binding HxlR family transcriptional regulator
MWIMLRTAHQRHVLCRNCGVAKVADLVGDSVSIIILRDLLQKPRRFTELELALAGVSSRTLTLKLKKLETAGLVSRHSDRSVGNRINYRLTSKGSALKPVVNAMRTYGKKYL